MTTWCFLVKALIADVHVTSSASRYLPVKAHLVTRLSYKYSSFLSSWSNYKQFQLLEIAVGNFPDVINYVNVSGEFPLVVNMLATLSVGSSLLWFLRIGWRVLLLFVFSSYFSKEFATASLTGHIFEFWNGNYMEFRNVDILGMQFRYELNLGMFSLVTSKNFMQGPTIPCTYLFLNHPE